MAGIKKCLSIILFSMLVVSVSFLFSADSVQAQSCGMTVIKNADPADNTVFDFSYTTVGFTEEFQLSDPDNNSIIFSLGDESTITEDLPLGWSLSSIECEPNEGSEGIISFTVNGPTVTVICSPNIFSQGTCTFNNVIATRNVPTLSQWGLIAMASILGIVGFMVARRKVTA